MTTRRRIAAVAALATVGLMGVGVPTASAHTGVLQTSSQCQDNGTRLVTYTGSTNNVPASGSGHTATLTVGEILPTGTSVSPATQTVTGNTTFTFTQTIAGDAGNAQATAFLVWGDGAKSDPIGKISFSKDCTPPVVVPEKPAPLVVVTSSDSKDCDAKMVTTTTVTTTTDWVLVDNVWVKSTPVVTQHETTRPATTQECPPVVPEKPAPLVVVTHSDDKNCDTKMVTTTTVTTTTDWVLVDNVWVKSTPVVTQHETTRPATTQECPIVVPEKPAPLVLLTSSLTLDCDSNTVTTTTDTTTTDWILVDNVWVEATPVVTESQTTVPATKQECPVVVPPVVVPPVVVTPVVVTPVIVTPVQVLGVAANAPRATPAAAVNPLPSAAAAGEADTSGQLFAGYLASLAAMLMLGAGFMLRRRHGDV